jgi:hypothetical protein
MALYGAFGITYKYVSYATYKLVPGGWGDWPGLGDLWARVLEHAASNSPIRAQSREQTDAAFPDAPLRATVDVDASKVIDSIRSSDFSVVSLEQLYGDGAVLEKLFLDLDPHGWFDRTTQAVLGNTQGKMSDKAAFLKDYGIKGIYMAPDAYGSYFTWDDAKYKSEEDTAIAAKEKYPDILVFLQDANEPPLDANYVAFHKKFVGAILAKTPGWKVLGPNKSFSIEGVNPKEMSLYIDQCGATTDVLNWHIYAQPPSMTLAETLYWSKYATGKLRTPGPAKVMYTEGDAWNQGDSQFNYLMDKAFTFLPEPAIIGSFIYCMDPRTEGGTYEFGVLQPTGLMSANYNGYWIWRDLRGQMTQTTITAPDDEVRRHIHAISSSSQDGKSFTTVVYYDTGYFDGPGGKQAAKAIVTVTPHLPPGSYSLQISDAAWNVRETKDSTATGPIEVTLDPCHAEALTWKHL